MTTEVEEGQDLRSLLGDSMDQLEEGTLDAPEVQSEALPEEELPPVVPDEGDKPDSGTEAPAEAPQEGQEAAQDAPAEQSKPEERDDAPSSWRAEGKEAWKELPQIAKQEIQRREADFHRTIQEYKGNAQIGQVMAEVITPYIQNMQQSGASAPQAIRSLLETENKLRNGDMLTKQQVLSNLAKEYGIDMQAALSAPPMDPRLVSYEQELYQARQEREEFRRMQAAAAQSHIAQFSADPRYNKHFDKLRPIMADLMQSGRSATIEQAFEEAKWMHPEVRQSLIEEDRAKATQQAQAKRTKSAAVGIRGGPASKGAPAKDDLRSIIGAGLDGTLD